MPFRYLLLVICFSSPSLALTQTPLSPNAPEDHPQTVNSLDSYNKTWAAAKPYLDKAKSTWPQAKARYLSGLPKGQVFFVTIELTDTRGKHEYVFIEVQKIENNTISGILASDINTVIGFQQGQKMLINENSIYDWLISYPDGHEEGNIVGTFIEHYLQQQH